MRRRLALAFVVGITAAGASCARGERGQSDFDAGPPPPDGRPLNLDGECTEETKQIFVLDTHKEIHRFEPKDERFVRIGPIDCPTTAGTFSMAMLGGGALTLGEALHNLFYSTLGNIVGGVLLIGLPFTYLNPRERDASPP